MKVLKLQIFNGNEMVEWRTFDDPQQEVIKIGSMKTSHVCLPGISRMHSVIERRGDRFRILDLGGDPPTYVSGERVKQAPIWSGDTIHFGNMGPWSMRVTIESATNVSVERERLVPRRDPKHTQSAFSDLLNKSEPYHHQKTFDNILRKLLELDDTDSMKRLTHQFRHSFDLQSDAGKAEKLRTLVKILRQSRRESRHTESIAVGLVQGALRQMKSGAEVYDLSEEDATDKALEHLRGIADLKGALAFIREFRTSHVKNRDDVAAEYIDRGMDRVENRIAKTLSLEVFTMLQYMARAGGFTKEQFRQSTDQARQKMIENLDQVVEHLDKYPPEVQEFIEQLRDASQGKPSKEPIE